MKNIFTILDDDEINQMQESTMRTIAELNETESGEKIVCKPGEHEICVNDYCELQCARCYKLFSFLALKEELIKSIRWSRDHESRITNLKKLKSLVSKNKVKESQRIIITGYHHIDGRGYTAIDKIFYDTD